MRPDKFTLKAQEALQEAQNIAEEYGNQEILPEHLLNSLLRQEDGIIRPILKKIGIDPVSVEDQTEWTPRVKKAPQAAIGEQRKKNLPAGQSREIKPHQVIPMEDDFEDF